MYLIFIVDILLLFAHANHSNQIEYNYIIISLFLYK